jgi:hypothetical protein
MNVFSGLGLMANLGAIWNAINAVRYLYPLLKSCYVVLAITKCRAECSVSFLVFLGTKYETVTCTECAGVGYCAIEYIA